ncbi:MAG: malonyl-CoA decarboxylase [Inquilinus sp.]|nr:malonyl-CoA decarboxylase [Inquilinus sp.]
MNSTSFFRDLLSTISDRGRTLVDLGRGRPGSGEDPIALGHRLVSGQGEASGVALAATLLAAYREASDVKKDAFFAELAVGFGADPERLAKAAERYLSSRDPEDAEALHRLAEPRRQELLRRLNLAPGGTAALVAMRRELLRRLKASPHLAAVDRDFEHLFTSWFNRGFLVLRRIDWQTPAAILEKIIQYEAVHEIGGWEDLRRRIDPPDRRLYAFFHPALVDEPLIFVEVALTSGIPEAIGPILADKRRPLAQGKATTAVFYSISNCQAGLRGISFGNFLIKQVVEELSRELPSLRTFVTLSPVPGFRRWLASNAEKGTLPGGKPAAGAVAVLDTPGWQEDEATRAELRAALMPLAAHYFTQAKTEGGRPVDPVARFHLGNGARLERINWFADAGDSGIAASAGIMVNYLYDTAAIEANHEAYANERTVVAAPGIRKLAKALPASGPALQSA